ncbi:hypothetical protein [Streptomyces sp. NPDC093707]|uniref:hypothetical protein n=1 Tax=Streptomyces sp. NPDC093707 TaxID=3154984 RepID=UPI00344FD209
MTGATPRRYARLSPSTWDAAPFARGLVTVVVTDGKATAADAVADAKALTPAVPTVPAVPMGPADLANAANVPAAPALPVRGR